LLFFVKHCLWCYDCSMVDTVVIFCETLFMVLRLQYGWPTFT